MRSNEPVSGRSPLVAVIGLTISAEGFLTRASYIRAGRHSFSIPIILHRYIAAKGSVMTAIAALQANSALSVLASTTVSSDTTAQTASLITTSNNQMQVSTATANSKSSSIGYAALVAELKSQDATTTTDQSPSGRTTSQVNAVYNSNRAESSADMSASLYSGEGLEQAFGGSRVQMQDVISSLKLTDPNITSSSYIEQSQQMASAAAGIQQAFSAGTLVIQNAYNVPGLMTHDGVTQYTGDANQAPTGLVASTATFDQQKSFGNDGNQNHYLFQTASGSAIYFSWS